MTVLLFSHKLYIRLLLQRLVDRLLSFGIHDNKASSKETSISAVFKEISAALLNLLKNLYLSL